MVVFWCLGGVSEAAAGGGCWMMRKKRGREEEKKGPLAFSARARVSSLLHDD
jgi:hypothetical protein